MITASTTLGFVPCDAAHASRPTLSPPIPNGTSHPSATRSFEAAWAPAAGRTRQASARTSGYSEMPLKITGAISVLKIPPSIPPTEIQK